MNKKHPALDIPTGIFREKLSGIVSDKPNGLGVRMQSGKWVFHVKKEPFTCTIERGDRLND